MTAELGARYELIAELGRGGSSVAHRVWDRVLELEVALKLLHVDTPADVLRREFVALAGARASRPPASVRPGLVAERAATAAVLHR